MVPAAVDPVHERPPERWSGAASCLIASAMRSADPGSVLHSSRYQLLHVVVKTDLPSHTRKYDLSIMSAAIRTSTLWAT